MLFDSLSVVTQTLHLETSQIRWNLMYDTATFDKRPHYCPVVSDPGTRIQTLTIRNYHAGLTSPRMIID